MDILTTILNFVAFLVVMVVALIGLLIVLLIVISLLPRDNPLRQMMIALAKPVGVMVGVSVVGVPVEFIPGIDALHDILGLIFIVFSWMKFAGEARLIWPDIGRYFSARAAPREASLTAQECYRHAIGARAKEDWSDMLHWMRLAAQKGHAEARAFVEDVERRPRSSKKMTPIRKNLPQARKP